MNLLTFVFLSAVFLWLGIGKLVNSDTHSGKAARALLAALAVRLRGLPSPPEEE